MREKTHGARSVYTDNFAVVVPSKGTTDEQKDTSVERISKRREKRGRR